MGWVGRTLQQFGPQTSWGCLAKVQECTHTERCTKRCKPPASEPRATRTNHTESQCCRYGSVYGVAAMGENLGSDVRSVWVVRCGSIVKGAQRFPERSTRKGQSADAHRHSDGYSSC